MRIIVPVYYAAKPPIKGTPALNTSSINNSRTNSRKNSDLKRRKPRNPVVNPLKQRSSHHKPLCAIVQSVANSISAHSAKTRVPKSVASSRQTKHTHKRNLFSTSSALFKHGSPTNRTAYTSVPILINSCIFLLVPQRSSGLFTQIYRLFIVQMSHLPAHVHLFCFILETNVPVRQFVPDGPATDGTPIIQKSAAFIYNYQAVTSESESKFVSFLLFDSRHQLI